MKVIAVMPAYNAEKTLEKTFRDIPPGAVDEVILGDDASHDDTVKIAQRLGITVIKNDKNRGYGSNQKMCYREALARNADIVVMIHPDYQYDSRLIPYMTGFIKMDVCDIVLGSRIRTRAETLAGGMPVYKYFSNRFLTLVENLFLGLNLSEFHTGFRAFSSKVLKKIAFEKNSDDFIFDQQILIQAVAAGFRIGDVPCPTRYFPEASSINFVRSAKYGLEIFWNLFLYLLDRLRLAKSALFEEKK